VQVATLLAAVEIQNQTARRIDELQQFVVQVRSRRGGGSGILWKDRTIVTNYHVVPGDRAEIETADGRRFEARVEKRDMENDLAMLRPEMALVGLPVARIGDSRSLRVGQLVLAIGHPFGVRGAATSGIIQSVYHRDGNRELIKADIELRPGNSGGPLFSADGAVIGVNSMIVGPGLALAVPAHVVERFLEKLPARLGLAAREVIVEGEAARAAGLSGERAVMLIEVVPDGIAAASGLLPGDIVVGVDGAKVVRLQDFAGRLQQRKAGQDVKFTVVRGGAVRDVLVQPRAA
jgi:serine protease Do